MKPRCGALIASIKTLGLDPPVLYLDTTRCTEDRWSCFPEILNAEPSTRLVVSSISVVPQYHIPLPGYLLTVPCSRAAALRSISRWSRSLAS